MKKSNSRKWPRTAIGSGVLLLILGIIILWHGYFYLYHHGVINLLFLLSLITFVISLGVVVAGEFSSIAAEKGYVDKKYFWYTFFVPAVGILLVIALPDRGSAAASSGEALPELDELPEL